MTNAEILNAVGTFSSSDCDLFHHHVSIQQLNKNDVVLKEGEICKSFYFVIQGSFIQFKAKEIDAQIIDLHVEREWMFNQESLTEQSPSQTSIKAFSPSVILSLSLESFHSLCSQSKAFLQFGKILNQTKYRTSLFDSSLNPADKYQFIIRTKPDWIKVFPLKIIASFLKVTPETLSRVRAAHLIS